jgi:pyruvate dehydrogenase E2 component (dihydrolipoamide acetyltransferase)
MSTTQGARVQVPDIGDFDAVPIIEILVAVGDTVSAEDPLVTLESDKATMDVPAPFDGVVREIGVAVGDSVAQGSELMTIEPAGDDADNAHGDAAGSEPALTSEPAEAPAQTIQTAPRTPGEARDGHGSGGDGPIYAAPSVRRLARELGVELRGVDGSGRKGRLTADDVRAIADPGQAATRDRGVAAPVAVATRVQVAARRAPDSTCCPGRRSTLRSSVRSSGSRARGSSASRRRTWRATG